MSELLNEKRRLLVFLKMKILVASETRIKSGTKYTSFGISRVIFQDKLIFGKGEWLLLMVD